MANFHSIGVDQTAKGLSANPYDESLVERVRQSPLIRRFLHQLKEILAIIIVSLVLISAVMQPLFRDALLARLRSILESF